MRHLDLFSGIGGFALAADSVWPGIEHVFCEIDPFCQNVLKKHWPDSKIYVDIRTLTNTESEQDRRKEQQGVQSDTGAGFDILTGGFPCQPASSAGKRKGKDDSRWLWPEMLRVVGEFRPKWVIGENVRGLLSLNGGMAFDEIVTDLEDEGYEVWPFVLPACGVNAPHRRERVWIVGHRIDTDGTGLEEARSGEQSAGDRGKGGDAPDTRQQRWEQGCESKSERTSDNNERQNWSRDWREVAAATCHDGVDDGLPKRMVILPDGTTLTPAKYRREALKAYGNAIVPQVAEQVMRAIRDSI